LRAKSLACTLTPSPLFLGENPYITLRKLRLGIFGASHLHPPSL